MGGLVDRRLAPIVAAPVLADVVEVLAVELRVLTVLLG